MGKALIAGFLRYSTGGTHRTGLTCERLPQTDYLTEDASVIYVGQPLVVDPILVNENLRNLLFDPG